MGSIARLCLSKQSRAVLYLSSQAGKGAPAATGRPGAAETLWRASRTRHVGRTTAREKIEWRAVQSYRWEGKWRAVQSYE